LRNSISSVGLNGSSTKLTEENNFVFVLTGRTNASIKLEHAVSVEGKAYTVSHYVDGKSVVILYLDFVFNGPAGSELTFFNINKAENKSS